MYLFSLWSNFTVRMPLDLHRQMVRQGVAYREPQFHPQRTVDAMRMLSAITDNTTRASVSHNLYRVSATDNNHHCTSCYTLGILV